MQSTNPFSFGALALDDTFADRESELAELTSDIRNGQDVVVFAPRRCGKSSLVWRAAAVPRGGERVLMAQVDLMTHADQGGLGRGAGEVDLRADRLAAGAGAGEGAAPFRGLRVQPTINVNPEDGSSPSASASAQRPAEIDATLERLLELPAELGSAGAGGSRWSCDEFQEIVDIDPGLPKLLRAVFQRQPEVAHVYLGSKHHIMERIFNDANEPFWRSAKSMELGPIPVEPFAEFIVERFRRQRRDVRAGGRQELLGAHRRPSLRDAGALLLPLGAGAVRRSRSAADLERALAAVLRSEHAHFSLLWDGASAVQKQVLQALAREPGHPFSAAYRRRHNLPPATNVQKALTALTQARTGRAAKPVPTAITEPFLAEWLRANILGLAR